MRLVSRPSAVAERAHEQRLGDAGNALEQHVAAREQGDEQAGHGAVLADDGLADLEAHAVHRLAQRGVVRRLGAA